MDEILLNCSDAADSSLSQNKGSHFLIRLSLLSTEASLLDRSASDLKFLMSSAVPLLSILVRYPNPIPLHCVRHREYKSDYQPVKESV